MDNISHLTYPSKSSRLDILFHSKLFLHVVHGPSHIDTIWVFQYLVTYFDDYSHVTCIY